MLVHSSLYIHAYFWAVPVSLDLSYRMHRTGQSIARRSIDDGKLVQVTQARYGTVPATCNPCRGVFG